MFACFNYSFLILFCVFLAVKDIFNYFRAVLASREISERALKLSEDAANVNPSNYTVW